MKLAVALLSSIGAQEIPCKDLVAADSTCSNQDAETLGATLDQCKQECLCDTSCTAATFQETDGKCIRHYRCNTFLSGEVPGNDLYNFQSCADSDRASCNDGGDDDGDAADVTPGCEACPGEVLASCLINSNSQYACKSKPGITCSGMDCMGGFEAWCVSGSHNNDESGCLFSGTVTEDSGADDGDADGDDELGFPCPSDDCWEFNSDSGTCQLKDIDSCTKVTCGATSMAMEIGSGVFADSDESMGLVEPALDDASDDDDTLGWIKHCDLDSDDCNMSHKVEGNFLIFTVQFSLVGNKRGRSDVEDKTIDLGDVVVNTAPFGIGVSFECTYGMTVDLTSNQFSVQEVTVSGTKAGDGSLEDGFAMTLNDDSTDALVLGSRLNVEVDWSLMLSDIDYYFQGCSVRHAANTDDNPTKVAVVKSGCYSEALHATRDTCSDGDGICMSFQTFTIEAESGTNQIIGCTIQLCNSEADGGCDGKTAPTCPDDAPEYVYTINGAA